MKKLLILAAILGLFLPFGSVVEAKPSWAGGENEERKEIRNEIRNEIRAEIKDARNEILQLRQQVWERLRVNFPFLLPAGVEKAEIDSISGTSLPAEIKVSKDGKTITLKITDKTIILRKFGGKSSLSELNVGDVVSARGTWEDSSEAVLDTRVLRDLSIQKRRGTFWGTIKSISGQDFILTSMVRGDQTVKTNESTKMVNRNNGKISFSDLKEGHRVRVTGLWDSTLKRIEEVTLIKDWSLPPRPTATPTPTI